MEWVLVAVLLCWTSQAASSRIVSPYGCQGFYGVSNDSTPWLSVARGPGFNLGHTYQYWLTKANVYVINAEASQETSDHWPVPPEADPVNGLPLAFYNDPDKGFPVRLLLQNAQNCLLDYIIALGGQHYTQQSYCFDPELPPWEKIVPDSNTNMLAVKYIYLVSRTHLVVISINNIQPVIPIIELPAGNFPTKKVVGAAYRHADRYADRLFIIRGSDQPDQPSEILTYRVNTQGYPDTGPALTFDHVTYLQGRSDALLIKDDVSELLWTQVVPNWNNSNETRGLLFDYGLQMPHRFRHGELNFTMRSASRWGALGFSFRSRRDAMMITSTDLPSSRSGFTIYAVYLDQNQPELQLVDALSVYDSTLPVLALGTYEKPNDFNKDVDFIIVMASHNVEGNACLQSFFHCTDNCPGFD